MGVGLYLERWSVYSLCARLVGQMPTGHEAQATPSTRLAACRTEFAAIRTQTQTLAFYHHSRSEERETDLKKPSCSDSLLQRATLALIPHLPTTARVRERKYSRQRIRTDLTVLESVRKKSPVCRSPVRIKGPPLDQDHPNLTKTTEFPYRAG